MKSRVTFHYDGDGRRLKKVELVGSWDDDGLFCEDWRRPGLVMKRDRDGVWKATLELTGDPALEWSWGVRVDGRWAVFEEQALTFTLTAPEQVVRYAPSSLTRMGATRDGRDLVVRLWAPHALAVTARIGERRLELERVGELWEGRLQGGWRRSLGKVYFFEVTTSEGARVLRSDPYARVRQGQQFGLGEVYLDPHSGREVHRFVEGPKVHFLRFEVVRDAEDPVYLVLSDGKPLTREQLLDRLGVSGRDVVEQHGSDNFWHAGLRSDGRIALARRGRAWSTMICNPELLEGLRYRFETESGAVLEDAYDTLLDGYHRWPRFGLVTSGAFEWRHDDAPRLARGPEELVIYQLHVGSVFGRHGNLERSTFKDVIERLDDFVDLGVTALELLPTNAFEGLRDWGYVGTNSLAQSQQYGFEDEGRWVDGAEALKRFVDAAHQRGLCVFTDVVYNHLGGDHNELWEFDGKKNPWFEWHHDPVVDHHRATPQPERQRHTVDCQPETALSTVRHTPWGPVPAYAKGPVERFFIDHALSQLEEFHLDGIRFDFTNLIHNAEGGGPVGWRLLRKLHRMIAFFYPRALTFAEEFPQHPVVVTPAGPRSTGGAGFQAMWDTEFQHRLVHAHGRPSILQQAARGHVTEIDAFIHHMVERPGFRGPLSAVTVISNHDEVGNASRTVLVGGDDVDWARKAARLTFGVGLFSPGMPIFFQGEESLATNPFSWGIPSTWDVGWDWLEADPDHPRRRHRRFCRAAIRLRREAVALEADAGVCPVHVHNRNGVLAFTRSKAGEELLVIASLSRGHLFDYPVATGVERWTLLLNSDQEQFGGDGIGRAEVKDGLFDVPAATVLVYRASPSQKPEPGAP